MGALVVDGAFAPPWWVHLVWIPVAAALTVAGLRFSKAWLLAQEYKHRARRGGILTWVARSGFVLKDRPW